MACENGVDVALAEKNPCSKCTRVYILLLLNRMLLLGLLVESPRLNMHAVLSRKLVRQGH